MIPLPARSTLFPYTTLFRSSSDQPDRVSFRYDAGRFRPETSGQVEIKRSEEHTSELQSHSDLVCRLLLEKKKSETCPWRRPTTRSVSSWSIRRRSSPQRP